MAEANFICQLCGVGFKTEDELQQHRLRAHEQSTDPEHYICELCNSTFSTQARLDLHIQQHHPDKGTAINAARQGM